MSSFSSPIQAQLIARYHRLTTLFLLLKKPFERFCLLFTDFKFLNSGAFLIVELNQAFWILYHHVMQIFH
jgi:hypothetical protein